MNAKNGTSKFPYGCLSWNPPGQKQLTALWPGCHTWRQSLTRAWNVNSKVISHLTFQVIGNRDIGTESPEAKSFFSFLFSSIFFVFFFILKKIMYSVLKNKNKTGISLRIYIDNHCFYNSNTDSNTRVKENGQTA